MAKWKEGDIMNYGTVKGVEKPISRLVLGTTEVNTKKLEESFKLLDAAFKLGCTTFDTAHVYAGGDSEQAIGQWIDKRKNRDKVVILDKGAHHNADRKRVTPFDITADLHDSLARLKTDYIDIYLLHRDNPDVPVGPIVECLNEHVQAGRIHAIGGSNWTHQRIQEANEYAEAHDLVPFVASSPHFGLAEQVQDPWGGGCITISGPKEEAAQKWYQQTNMAIYAYSGLAHGFFSGRITCESFASQKSTINAVCLRGYCHEVNFKRLERVEILAQEKGLTIPQIALAYIMNYPLNVFAIVSTTNLGHLKTNVEACELNLSEAELAWLNLERDSR